MYTGVTTDYYSYYYNYTEPIHHTNCYTLLLKGKCGDYFNILFYYLNTIYYIIIY